jgi:hypothetical protein
MSHFFDFVMILLTILLCGNIFLLLRLVCTDALSYFSPDCADTSILYTLLGVSEVLAWDGMDEHRANISGRCYRSIQRAGN